MSFENNVYYSPDKSGLSNIVTLDEPGRSYDYRTLIVVQDNKTGRVFYAEDSGCSCPTPFEDYIFISADDTNMDEVTQFNFGVFEESVNNFPVDMSERQDCLKTVANALKMAIFTRNVFLFMPAKIPFWNSRQQWILLYSPIEFLIV